MSANLEKACRSIAEKGPELEAKYGSLAITVASDNVLAIHKVDRVAGYDIEVTDGISFLDPTGETPVIKLQGAMIHFHPVEPDDTDWDD